MERAEKRKPKDKSGFFWYNTTIVSTIIRLFIFLDYKKVKDYRLVTPLCLIDYQRYRVISIEELSRTQELAAKKITPLQTDYTSADRILRKLKLTKKENDVLNCYLAGMAYTEIAKFLCVNASTVWRRKMKSQQKYAQNFGEYF